MKTRMVEERIGEDMGPIDWDYDFWQHYSGMCSTDEQRRARYEKDMQAFRELEAAWKAGRPVQVTTDGGWPRCGWGTVVNVCMYDGWPYWRPVPSIGYMGLFGVVWCHPWNIDIQYPKS